MADFKKLSLAELASAIRENTDSLVLMHRHPDGDAIGSGFALRLLLQAMGCRVYCACEDELPERLAFLADEREAAEGIRYDRLPKDFAPLQIIAVDTASPGQAGALYPLYQGKISLMIDHHERGEMYADGWVEGGRAATGEMIFELSRELFRQGRISSVPLRVDMLLYAAISSDTGCFRYSNVSPDTHRIAAELLKSAACSRGFDPADVNHRLFEVKSPKLLLAEKIGVERLQTFEDGRVGIVTFPLSVKKEHGLTDEHLETLVDIPRALPGVEVAVAIREVTDGAYRVSMRSCSDIDVSLLCASFGGGGHVKAAGCSITSSQGMDDVVSQVLCAIRNEGTRGKTS